MFVPVLAKDGADPVHTLALGSTMPRQPFTKLFSLIINARR